MARRIFHRHLPTGEFHARSFCASCLLVPPGSESLQESILGWVAVFRIVRGCFIATSLPTDQGTQQA